MSRKFSIWGGSRMILAKCRDDFEGVLSYLEDGIMSEKLNKFIRIKGVKLT